MRLDEKYSWAGNASGKFSIPVQPKSKQSIAEEYIEAMRRGLLTGKVEDMTYDVLTDGERSKVIMNLFKGNNQIGTVRRTFSPLGAELSKVELAGGTGVLDPLYAAESKFFKDKDMRVKAAFASDITKAKWDKHYEGSISMGNNRFAYSPPQRSSTMNEAMHLAENSMGSGRQSGKVKSFLNNKTILGALKNIR